MKIYLCVSTCHSALYDFMILNSQFHIVCEREEWHFQNAKVGFYSLLFLLGSAKSECSDCTLQLVLCMSNWLSSHVCVWVLWGCSWTQQFEVCHIVGSLNRIQYWRWQKLIAKNILGFNKNSCLTLFMYSLWSKHCILWYYHEETTHIKWVQMW